MLIVTNVSGIPYISRLSNIFFFTLKNRDNEMMTHFMAKFGLDRSKGEQVDIFREIFLIIFLKLI